MSYNRRYYLHRQVKKYGIQLIARYKTINVTAEQAESAQQNKYVAELSSKHSYSVQFINPLFTL
jgi:hypothetical protein